MKHKHTTLMKMLTTVILLLLCLAVTLSGCAYPPDAVGNSASTTTTVTTTTEPAVTTERADGLKKSYCKATLEDDFVDNKIIFGVFPEYNEYEYTVDDFADVGCIDFKEIVAYKEDPYSSRILRITLDKHSKENVLAMIKIMEQREDIRYAHPSFYEYIQVDANDIQYTIGNQWAIDKINLPNAWNITTGVNTVYVGVLDTGIEATHPDLVNRVSTGLGERFDDSQIVRTHLEDSSGHGTHVAGIIGAQGNNSRGIVGTCWDVEIVSIAAFSSVGTAETENVIAGIDYAKEIGIDILNYSAGSNSSIYAGAYQEAVSEFPGLFVCAAGNLKDGENESQGNNDIYPHYPSNLNLPNVIAVGASTSDDEKAEFSHYGANNVDIFAPGEGILSCYPEWMCDYRPTTCYEQESHTATYYHTLSGTSMATPYVTGVAALLLSANPDLTPCEIKDTILSNVDEISALEGLCATGGRLNAYKALTNVRWHSVTCTIPGDHSHTRTCIAHNTSQTHSHSYQYTNLGSSGHFASCLICAHRTWFVHTIRYTNKGLLAGHTGGCIACDYTTETEAHTWLEMPLNLRCGKCIATTVAIPVPIASLPPEIRAKLEQMGYIGDFAMDIGGGTVLCRIGDDYYLVRGQTELTALSYLQNELSVISPDLQTESFSS